VSVTIGAAVSTALDPLAAASAAAAEAGRALDGDADLALVFASGAHLTAPEATLEGVHDAISPTVP
jgi:hypothetical protein